MILCHFHQTKFGKLLLFPKIHAAAKTNDQTKESKPNNRSPPMHIFTAGPLVLRTRTEIFDTVRQ